MGTIFLVLNNVCDTVCLDVQCLYTVLNSPFKMNYPTYVPFSFLNIIQIDKSGEMLATIFNTNGKTFCNIQKIKTDSKQHHHQQQLDLETGVCY